MSSDDEIKRAKKLLEERGYLIKRVGPTKRFTFLLNKTLYDEFYVAAKRRGLKINAALSEAIEDYLEKLASEDK